MVIVADTWTKAPGLSLSGPFKRVSCLGEVEFGERKLKKYEFLNWPGDPSSLAETVYVDVESKLPVRFDTRTVKETAGTVTFYRHDALIRIDPPRVDLEQRRARSMRNFLDAVQNTDAVCREEALSAIQRGRTASFHYDVRRFFHSHLFGVSGIFVPLHSVRNVLDDSGGGEEQIVIGEQGWNKRGGKHWEPMKDGRQLVDWIVGELLAPSADHVGGVKCLGKASIAGREYRVYDYDFYRDWQSARKLEGTRRMLVDEITGLPTQTTGLWSDGTRHWVEMRWYDPELRIERPPLNPSDGPIQPVPKRRMSTEEYRRAMWPELFAHEIVPR